MQVYIEYAFLDNFIIDFILLKLSTKCAKIKTGVLRISIASFIGALIAVILPLFSVGGVWVFIIKVLLGLLITYVGGIYLKISNYLLESFYFFIFTFLSGGAIIGLFNLACIDYENYFIINYDSIMPIGITFLIVYLTTKSLVFLVKKMISNLELETFRRRCEVYINNKKILADGFIDTGNKLYDEYTGLPVIVASKNFIKKIAEKGALPNSYRSIKIETVNGESTINIFYIDKLLIYKGINVNIYNNVLIGEGGSNLYVDGYCDLLLHYTLK